MEFFIAFAIAAIVTFLLVRPISALAHKLDFEDKPTERKNHKVPVPLIGGVIMFLGFSAPYAVFILFADGFSQLPINYGGILLGAALILSIGLFDDFFKTRKKEFPIWPRLLVQIGAASIVYAVGVRFWGIDLPWTSGDPIVFIPVIQYFLTVMWILGITTVMNWIDGLDGLAGGTAGITACTLFVFAMFMGETSSAFMAAALVGSIVAYLRFNFFPTKTKIFMGDSGANFLGYMLAVISLHGAFKQATVIAIIVPVLAMGLPIFDSISVMIRRIVNRAPVHKADHRHLHQRLQKKGLSAKHTVVMLLLFCMCLNLTSIILILI